MTGDMNLTVYREGADPESITLTQATLGMYPYVLIEARPASDGSGEVALFVSGGRGAEDDLTVLPILFLTELPVEQNPISRELIKLREALEFPEQREIIDRVAEQLGVPMPDES